MLDEKSEKKDLLEEVNKKYSNDNGFVLGFPNLEASNRLWENYFKFKRTLTSLQIGDKIDDILEKYEIYIENNDNEDENDKIYDEMDNITKEYDTIIDEADENAKYYDGIIMVLYWDYKLNYWRSGIGHLIDKITTGIISLLNKNYIDYEKRIVVILDKIKNLSLKFINSN